MFRCLLGQSGNKPSRCAALVSLADARELTLANRMLARSGGDPLADKRRVQSVPTFADAAQRVLEQKQGGWRGRWHAQNWWRGMERYAFPRIGRRPVSEVNTADVLEILTPIWHVRAETARAVRQRIRSVLEWAIAMDLRHDNPCDLHDIRCKLLQCIALYAICRPRFPRCTLLPDPESTRPRKPLPDSRTARAGCRSDQPGRPGI